MRKIVLSSALILSLLAIYAFTAVKNEKQETKKENLNKSEKKKMGTIHLTKEEFLKKVVDYEKNPTEWKYLGDKPAIIDFYASWCGPCKMIAPILEELANEYADDIYIYKVNTEEEQELAAAFGIRSIPTLIFAPMGEAPQMAQGALPKHAFKEAIETVLLKKETAKAE
ncbi:MAG: thioredoxin [Porphyromonadaceae bacterium]|jgi:thioredoxin|nr:thioredoxin [Porphyromonadaceae bacterium]